MELQTGVAALEAGVLEETQALLMGLLEGLLLEVGVGVLKTEPGVLAAQGLLFLNISNLNRSFVMAHFAEVDQDGKVKRVIVVDNKDTSDAQGVEKEYIGAAFCEKLLGGTWKQTSYNGNFRKNYAGIGYTYRADIDAFVPPQPFSSWVLNADAKWEAPVVIPNDGKRYEWNEDNQNWVEVNNV